MKGKIFTRQEATNMLPLLRRIVMDAKACTKLIDRHERAVAATVLDGESSDSAAEDTADHKQKIQSLRVRRQECEKELEDLGAFLDDAKEGIIKLYGEKGSRIVYYTWRLGEPEVLFWHPIEKSYVDRQPIDGDECIAENASGR